MPRQLKEILHAKGISMVGVLVAAGAMGGLALFLADVAKKQHIIQKKVGDGGGVDHPSQQGDLDPLGRGGLPGDAGGSGGPAPFNAPATGADSNPTQKQEGQGGAHYRFLGQPAGAAQFRQIGEHTTAERE